MVLIELVDDISKEGVSKSKQICYQSIEVLIQVSLSIFPIYLQETGTDFRFNQLLKLIPWTVLIDKQGKYDSIDFWTSRKV